MKPYDEWTQQESESVLDAAIEELHQYRSTNLTPAEIEALKAKLQKVERDMRLMSGKCRVCGKYKKSCNPKHDELDGCAAFEWRGLEDTTCE